MNFARWSILFSLGTLALLWLGLWQRSVLSEMTEGLDGAPRRSQADRAARAQAFAALESLKGENLQGEADMQSSIYKVAGTDRVGWGT